MSFPFVASLTGAAVFTQSDVKKARLGTLGMLRDGRMYRYCKAGTALTQTWGAVNGNRHLTACTGESAEAALSGAVARGDRSFIFLDTSTIAADYYADGYIAQMQLASELHQIKSSTAGVGTSVTCTLDDDDFFATAVASGQTVNVYPSPWGKVILANVQASGYEGFVCVPPYAITSAYYFWGQVTGPCWITVTSTWPLAATTDIEVVFHMDGSLKMADEAYNGSVSNQIAGHVIVSGQYGDCLIMLQIE